MGRVRPVRWGLNGVSITEDSANGLRLLFGKVHKGLLLLLLSRTAGKEGLLALSRGRAHKADLK